MSNDKAKRKEFLRTLKQRQAEEFLKSLPLTRETFQRLFNVLQNELQEERCDDTLRITKRFLQNEGISENGLIINWLNNKGGFCDCEVLANVKEKFL